MDTNITTSPGGPMIVEPEDLLANPEKYNEQIQQGLGSFEPPEPPEPRDGEVELPAGFLTEDGQLRRDAFVRELNGEDEEILARQNFIKNPAKYVTTLLSRGVVEVAGLKAEMNLLRSLVVGDRDFLVLAVRQATFGDLLDMTITCPIATCGEKMDIRINLAEEIPIKRLEESRREWEVELRRGRKATVALPTGFVQEEAFSRGQRTIAEINTDVLSGCVRTIDGTPVFPQDIKKLGAADRRTILQFISDTEPGPNLTEGVKYSCDACATENTIPIDIADLFR